MIYIHFIGNRKSFDDSKMNKLGEVITHYRKGTETQIIYSDDNSADDLTEFNLIKRISKEANARGSI